MRLVRPFALLLILLGVVGAAMWAKDFDGPDGGGPFTYLLRRIVVGVGLALAVLFAGAMLLGAPWWLAIGLSSAALVGTGGYAASRDVIGLPLPRLPFGEERTPSSSPGAGGVEVMRGQVQLLPGTGFAVPVITPPATAKAGDCPAGFVCLDNPFA